MMKILTTTSSFGKVSERPLRMLEKAGFEVVLNPYGRKLSLDESKSIISGIDALIAGTELLNEDVFSHADHLKYLCRLGAGTDNVDFEAAHIHGIKVENTPLAHVDGVAELTLGGIISSLRGLANAHAKIKTGTWEKPMGSLLKGKSVGIVGLGRVGKRLVELLQPFGTEIVAYDPIKDKEFSAKYNVRYLTLEEVMKTANVVTVHVPLTKDSKYLIDDRLLDLLGSEGLLVNTSRGGLVDERALLDYLRRHSKASAYLDTFENEPYDGPLKQLNNCTLTPHIGSYASEVRVDMEIEAAQNVINFFSNE